MEDFSFLFYFLFFALLFLLCLNNLIVKREKILNLNTKNTVVVFIDYRKSIDIATCRLRY